MRPSAGQAAVEIALSLPILLLLLLGGVNVGMLLSNKVTAAYASRQGARLAAQLGNGQGLSTSQVDQQVVQVVLATAAQLNFGTIREIDIYAPGSTNGVFNSSSDPYDSYDAKGNLLHLGFPTTARNVSTPTETSIGVQVVWQYTPPFGTYGISVQTTEYTVMKAAAVLS